MTQAQLAFVEIVEITNAKQKTNVIADIIRTLPEWFGIAASNERYIHEATSKDVFAAPGNLNQMVGAIALRYHFQSTAEIWWMGVKPEYHRGIGTLLFEAARARAKEVGCRTLAVMTLSPRSTDLYYARTRVFYESQGFRLFLEFNETDPRNPLAWMTRPVEE